MGWSIAAHGNAFGLYAVASGQLILDHVRASPLLLYHVIYDICLPSRHCEESRSPFIFIISTVLVIRETVKQKHRLAFGLLTVSNFPVKPSKPNLALTFNGWSSWFKCTEGGGERTKGSMASEWIYTSNPPPPPHPLVQWKPRWAILPTSSPGSSPIRPLGTRLSSYVKVGDCFKEAAWPSGLCVGLVSGRPGFEYRSRPLCEFFMGRPEFISSATFVNRELFASSR